MASGSKPSVASGQVSTLLGVPQQRGTARWGNCPRSADMVSAGRPLTPDPSQHD